jgi:hypothetical protein
MASTVFDKLWDEVYGRERDLILQASALAKAHKTGILEAARLARILQEAGRPFFEHCEALFQIQQRNALDRIRRRHKLSPHQVKLVKEMLEKATKGW